MSIVKYQEHGLDLACRMEDGQAWMTVKQVAELFGVESPAIIKHVQHILADDELVESTTRSFRVVQTEGNRSVNRDITHLNQDMVLHIGYRVRSERGSEYRRWATMTLKEFSLQAAQVMTDLLAKGPAPKNSKRCTYFIRSKRTRLVKIGASENPLVRLKGLTFASHYPDQLDLLCVISVDVEKELHARFIKHRVHGEWFRLVPELESYILNQGGNLKNPLATHGMMGGEIYEVSEAIEERATGPRHQAVCEGPPA